MNKKCIIATVMLLILTIALAVSLALSIIFIVPINDDNKVIDNPLVLQEQQANGLSLSMMPVSSVSDTQSSYNINVTVVPADAVNQKILWTMQWSEQTLGWANGKNIADYVTLTTDNSTKIGTITCKKAFGTQIIVKATTEENADIFATCSLDYAQKVTEATLNFGNVDINLGGTTNVKFEIAKGVQGLGGLVKANYTTSDVYSLEENFTVSVKFVETGSYFKLKGGKTISGASQDLNVEFNGKSIYYDYDHSIAKWMIFIREGDILFKNLSTAQIADYFSEIVEPILNKVELTITGEYSSYTYNSTIKCIGYTNNTRVSAINMDKTGYVF